LITLLLLLKQKAIGMHMCMLIGEAHSFSKISKIIPRSFSSLFPT
jgi:hypothetical protein